MQIRDTTLNAIASSVQYVRVHNEALENSEVAEPYGNSKIQDDLSPALKGNAHLKQLAAHTCIGCDGF